MDSTVLFQAGDISVPLPNFVITDDTTALETNEIYQLSFISSSPSQDVNLGGPTEIIITDEDGELNQAKFKKKIENLFNIYIVVTVSFGSLTYSFSEGAGQFSGINISLSTSIAQALNVTITGGIYNVLSN